MDQKTRYQLEARQRKLKQAIREEQDALKPYIDDNKNHGDNDGNNYMIRQHRMAILQMKEELDRVRYLLQGHGKHPVLYEIYGDAIEAMLRKHFPKLNAHTKVIDLKSNHQHGVGIYHDMTRLWDGPPIPGIPPLTPQQPSIPKTEIIHLDKFAVTDDIFAYIILIKWQPEQDRLFIGQHTKADGGYVLVKYKRN